MDQEAATAIQEATQVVEGVGDIDVGDRGSPDAFENLMNETEG
jgi:hypothetical protein